MNAGPSYGQSRPGLASQYSPAAPVTAATLPTLLGMPEFVTARVGTCWWCGDPADSREHKFKRTDIDRAFGGGPYRNGRTLIAKGYDRPASDVTGSKSKAFKFKPTICQRCNGHRSQPFDSAYDGFMDHIFANEDAVLSTGQVELRQVYGGDWQDRGLGLARYFVKHICCRLANVADERVVEIDQRLLDFLDGGGYPPCLDLVPLVDMSVAECWRAMHMLETDPGLYGSFLHLTGIAGLNVPRPEPLQLPEGGKLVGWFGIYWWITDPRLVEENPSPNRLAGPVVSFLVTDWHLGTQRRMIFSQICAAIESGDLDPRENNFGQLAAAFGIEDASLRFPHPDNGLVRPAASPIGLARYQPRDQAGERPN